jgi:tRNA-modifying protein YgfZ
MAPYPAVVASTNKAVVEVVGDDRYRFLEDVTTQAFLDSQPGQVRGALFLDAHGAPLLVFDVLVHPERLWLLSPTWELAEQVVSVLGGRTFLADARFRQLELHVAALRGEDAHAVAAQAGLAVASGRWDSDGTVVRAGVAGGLDLVGDPADVAEVVERLVASGARPGDAADLDDATIVLGEPAWGREIIAPHLPEELGLLPTHVHLAKGCYPGQEAVARMWQLGRPRRRLARLAVTGTVAPGDEAGQGRGKVTITSVSRSGDRALGFVPGDAAQGDRLPIAEDAEVQVLGLVGEDLPVPGHDPAVTRRRDQRAG